jgi:hypothetical protein
MNKWIITHDEPNTKSASLNAGMMTNIQVSLAWMPVKALQYMGVRSALSGEGVNKGIMDAKTQAIALIGIDYALRSPLINSLLIYKNLITKFQSKSNKALEKL